MEWGEIIRRLREDRGLTQQNLADDVGVDVTTVIRWEQSSSMKADRLEQLAKAFKIQVSELYTYKTDPEMLSNPLQYYQNRKRVDITVQLDGTAATLNEWISTLKKINKALE